MEPMTKPKIAAAAFAGCLYATTLLASPQLVPNSVKYRNSGIPNAKGVAGAATVESRALLGADGVTEIELTTGSFDGAAPPSGTIEKIQLKLSNPEETTNFNDVSGTAHVARVEGLARLDPIDLHMNVKAGATTVVQLSDVVKLRPNLRVTGYSGPALAITGAPVTFAASIRETNGDVGERASCVLLANGVEVDRARNIWVDAGGSVACTFRHTFAAPGSYDMKVAVVDSDPGDFLAADNEAGASLTVYSAASAFDAWSWTARDYTTNAHYYEDGALLTGDSHVTGWNQASDFYAMIANRPIDLNNVRLSVSEESDGETISNAELTEWDSSPFCAWSYDGVGRMVSACNVTSEDRTFVTLSVNRASGDVTYVSEGSRRSTNPDTHQLEDHYFSNTDHNQYGVQKRFGNTASLRVTFGDGTTAWEAQPFLTLTPYTLTDNQPLTCANVRGRGFRCTSHEYHEEGVQGTVTGGE
jgi:hypothetical protein